MVTAGGVLDFTENDPPTAIDMGLTVADVDNANLTSATVQITNNSRTGRTCWLHQHGEHHGRVTPASGLLTLTGSDTVAN